MHSTKQSVTVAAALGVLVAVNTYAAQGEHAGSGGAVLGPWSATQFEERGGRVTFSEPQ